MKKVKRKIVEIDEERCDGCGLCVPACAEGAIQVIDGKARLVADKYCDGLGACLGECPHDALRVIEREAEEFDEESVEQHLRSVQQAGKPAESTMPCGCPSAQFQSFKPREPAAEPAGDGPVEARFVESALTHWPIQIRLIPPTAPFLKGANLLVLADCVAAAYPQLHGDLMRGRVVMMGCPKFDDAELYVERFTEIFRTANIQGVTVAMMEVPCCAGLSHIVEEARRKAGVALKVEQVVIDARAGRLQRMQRSA